MLESIKDYFKPKNPCKYCIRNGSEVDSYICDECEYYCFKGIEND